jgi:surfeit locus 1 family protein
MSRRSIAFCVLAVLAAAVCVRLGVWQLARLGEKVRRNGSIAEQQRMTPAPLASLPRDTAAAHYRPAVLTGLFDYEHELVLSGRTHQGSPGVELLTPVRIAGSDTGVLVNRGWVYSPDGGRVDRSRWHESDTARVSGYVELYAPDAGVTASAADPRIVRRVSRAEIASKIPYPVSPYYLVATGDTADGHHPARRELPALDEGPHRSYAIQWFTFATFALAGALMIVLRERHPYARSWPDHGPSDATREHGR